MDEERREVIEEFYRLYRELQKKYKLRMRSRFGIHESALIEIWEDSGRTIDYYICRAEDEEETMCYRKAINDLKHYEKMRMERMDIKAG